MVHTLRVCLHEFTKRTRFYRHLSDQKPQKLPLHLPLALVITVHHHYFDLYHHRLNLPVSECYLSVNK